MRALEPFRLEVHFSQWEFKARHHMCASDMQSMPLSELLSMADGADRAAWDALHLGYTETRGLPALREAIASTYERAAPADVLCFAGAEEAIYVAMHALLGPQDHVITLIPNYQSAESVPLSLCATTGIPLDPLRSWDLDLDRLRDAIRPNTKMICINFPHNPTGKVISQAAFEAVVGLARERGLYLLSDEVYRLLERTPALRLPQAADLYERALSLGVMSKAYGLPGLRMGWIVSKDGAALSAMERLKHYTTICSSAPSELLSVIALKARERILARNRALTERNLAHLNAFFAENPDRFEWRVPDGGCIGYPRYLGPEGVETFTRDLLERSGVLLLPASIFASALGPTPVDRFRVGYGRANIEAGLHALREHLGRPRA